MSGPVLIQGAMEVETDWLVSRLERPEAFSWGGFQFWRGDFQGLDLTVSRTGIGTIYAAGATAVGIEKFHPRVVINQGIAGSHCESLHVGDIVVGESCIHIHNLKTPPRGRGEGYDASEWEFHDPYDGAEPLVYASDPVWLARFEAAAYTGGGKASGRLGGGDIFNREHDRILWLREHAGERCEDMESIASYQLCHRFGTPCIGLRIISNNELTGEPYQREVGVRLQSFILDALTSEEVL